MAYNNVINIINNTITNTTKKINIIVIKQERGNMMKFRCNKEELLKGISIVSRFAYSKYQQSILECIHIKAEGEYIYMDTFDMTTAIRTKINAEITEEGETAIPARVLNEIVSKISSGEILFERINNTVQITGANASANLSEMDAAQFPVFPECEEDEEKMIEIKQDDLKAMIDKTSFSVYTGDDRPIFTGLLLETNPSEKKVSMVGIDGVRLAIYRNDFEGNNKIKAIIPSKMLKEASRILESGDETVRLYFTDSACFMINDKIEIFTRLLDGEFINYGSIVPSGYKTRVRVNVSMLLQRLDLMMVLAREDSSNIIHLSFEDACLNLQSDSRYGNAKDMIYLGSMDGENLKIAFNARFLLDIFRVIEDDEVVMEFNGRLQAGVIKPVNNDNFLYLVVPVNVAER